MTNTVVAFDLYGTLLSTASVSKALANHFGAEKANSIATVWRKYQLEYTWRLNSMGQYQHFSVVTRSSLQHTLAEHNLSLDDSAVEQLMKEYDNLGTFPDVEKGLSALRQKPNITCVVFSNGTKDMVTNSLHRSDALKSSSSTFTDIITVDQVKIFKPAPEVYQYLARRVGKESEIGSMWLVSSNPFDVVGARAVGMQAAWVDRTGNGWQDKLSESPTVVVKGIDEVAVAVEKYSKA